MATSRNAHFPGMTPNTETLAHMNDGHIAVVPQATGAAQTITPAGAADSFSIQNISNEAMKVLINTSATNFTGNRTVIIPARSSYEYQTAGAVNAIDSLTVSVVDLGAVTATAGADTLADLTTFSTGDALAVITFVEA